MCSYDINVYDGKLFYDILYTTYWDVSSSYLRRIFTRDMSKLLSTEKELQTQDSSFNHQTFFPYSTHVSVVQMERTLVI